MEATVGAASWLLRKVLNKLSDDVVAGYVASREFGLNFDKIKDELNLTLALLHLAQGRDVVSNNPGLQGLLESLSKKADEAEDALDELHYFMIQDELYGTREAAPDLGGGLGAQALHARHAARNTAGIWLSCFSCCRSQDDIAAAAAAAGNTSKAKSDGRNDGHVDNKLPFDRVTMSNKIKQLIEDLHSKCCPISDLLKIINPSSSHQPNMPAPIKRPTTGSETTQTKLYGRDAIFKKAINEITNCINNGETFSVLPIVGPGGIGKTTFTQHIYSDKRIEQHFTVKVWVCVSTNFDVVKLSKEILSCLPASETEGNKVSNETTNLDQLQKSIAERLKSKRFLIVLDDIWECSSNDEWQKLLAPFKKGESNGNMVLVTTRFPKIAEMVTKATDPINIQGLEPGEFWKFFQVCVFGEIIQDGHDKEDLIAIARQMANKLKCNPLAAKAVGRLLSERPSHEQWVEILEKKEWLNQKHEDDIIPALKISYDYLPFHLRKCFSYCALFPKDYKFDTSEISRFWISIGIIDSSDQNVKNDSTGSKYLNELLDNGFLMKGDDNCYVIHDLMHELSQSVSSKDCANISCSSFSADDIPSSICHLSILMQYNHIDNFAKEMDKLKKRIDVGNLQSLMIFGEYNRASLVNILKDIFKEIKGLRVLFIFMNSSNSLPHNFSKLVHLRYLKLKSPSYSEVCLPQALSRFYHLKFLDLQDWQSSSNLPKDISNLVNLVHFGGGKVFHSNVPKVGKMNLLQELKGFHVKKESVGFELRELGQLEELGGELTIYGLENVRTTEEAKEAKLMAKRNLIELTLVWSRKQPSVEDDILDSLQPHFNLRALSIVNHGGATGPSWLCSNIHLKNLENLLLEGVSWSTLPPFGHMYHLRNLKLKNIVGICKFGPDFIGGVTEKSFIHLKEVEFADMLELVEWVGGANIHLFSRLEKVRCTNCPKLTVLLLSRWSSSCTQDDYKLFPNLCHLHIDRCPKLCLPPLPHTSVLSYFHTDHLVYEEESLKINDASSISFTDLQKLHPLRSTEVRRCEEAYLKGMDDGVVLHSVQSLDLTEFPVTRKSLSNLFRCFPCLSRLHVSVSHEHHDEDVVLQFPPSSSLREVSLVGCKNLIVPMEDGGGFQGLSSLESVWIINCIKPLSPWSMGEAAQSIRPFPPNVKELCLWDERSTLSMALFSNLTSLDALDLGNCTNLTTDSLSPLITRSLESLSVFNWRDDETGPYSIAADLLAEMARTKTMPAGSFRLMQLRVDSISAVLVAPVCTCLSATLQMLYFWHDWRVESFTEEQEQALQLLTSLQRLYFYGCRALRSLPQELRRLSSLETLYIDESPRIRSLANKGLPDSLEYLAIYGCCAELYVECQKLRGTRPDIHVDAKVFTVES